MANVLNIQQIDQVGLILLNNRNRNTLFFPKEIYNMGNAFCIPSQ